MKLWLLRPINDPSRPSDPWTRWYDKAHGFVIRAKDERTAREIAGRHSGDETADAWNDPIFSSCVHLNRIGPTEMIMRDFHAS